MNSESGQNPKSKSQELPAAQAQVQSPVQDRAETSELLLVKLQPLSRALVSVIALEFLVLLLLFLLFGGNVHFAGVNALAGALLSAFVYMVARSKMGEQKLEDAIAISLVFMASLLVASFGASGPSHYLLPLSLGAIALYRKRRLLALSSVSLLVEQSLRTVLLPETVLGSALGAGMERSQLVNEHFCWLAVSSGLLILLSGLKENSQSGAGNSAVLSDPASPLPPSKSGSHAFSGEKSPSDASGAKAVSAEAALKAAGAAIGGDLGELLKSGAEVGARARKLQKSVSGIEGPLKRMMQSINAANRSLQEIKDELSKTVVSVIHVTQSAEVHASKANEVFKAADEAAYGSQIGAMSTEQTIRNMDRIRDQMDSIEKRMENLLGKSQMMVKVVGIADELALQSKVLSVNAAIEAAKAGDRGQGFSAVAKEVKSLANQSKEATRQVRQILKEIQASISEVRRSIALGNETVDLASDQCRSTADSIKVLDNSVSSSRDAAETIMNSSKDQVQGIMLISRAMNDIQIVSDQNSGSLGNLHVEAQKLNSITRELIMEVGGYQGFIDDFLAQCEQLKNTGGAEPSQAAGGGADQAQASGSAKQS